MRTVVVALAACSTAWTAVEAQEPRREAIVVMRALSGPGDVVGEVILRDSPHGMLVIPSLAGLSVGPHAAHVHEKPNCGAGVVDGSRVPGGAAGGHYDPDGAGAYAGPYGEGALGDLPNLYVEADGRARIPVLAPRVRVEDVAGRALMIHAGADRYGPTFPSTGAQNEAPSHAHAGMRMSGDAAGGPEEQPASDDRASSPEPANAAMSTMDGNAATEMTDPHGGMRMYCGLIGPPSTGARALPE